MRAYLISIGDELLIGQTINTNAAFIANQLSQNNIPVIKTSVIADDIKEISKEFNYASGIADIIVCTGGLGPTHDDITRKAVVEYFSDDLILNNDVLNDIKKLVENRGRHMTEILQDQAYIPSKATPIRNSAGTAPGYWFEENNKIFIIMPGVPLEMKTMMNSWIIPKLKEVLGEPAEFIKYFILQTTGLPESILAGRLGNLDDLLGGAKLAFLPNQYGVKLRITVTDKDEQIGNNHLIEIEQKIRSKIGRYIFGRDDELLEEVVGRLLNERQLRIAVAESCTGGGLADRITNINGSSNYFDRGVITYSNASKVELLKVDEDLMTEKGAVSAEVAMQMAEGIKSVSGVDIGIALTGIMGPAGGSKEKPVGTVFIGYCDERVCTAKRFQFGEDRLLNKNRATQAALEIIRRNLLGITFEE